MKLVKDVVEDAGLILLNLPHISVALSICELNPIEALARLEISQTTMILKIITRHSLSKLTQLSKVVSPRFAKENTLPPCGGR